MPSHTCTHHTTGSSCCGFQIYRALIAAGCQHTTTGSAFVSIVETTCDAGMFSHVASTPVPSCPTYSVPDCNLVRCVPDGRQHAGRVLQLVCCHNKTHISHNSHHVTHMHAQVPTV